MPRARRSASLKQASNAKDGGPEVNVAIKTEPLTNMDEQDSSGSYKRKRSEKSVPTEECVVVKSEPANKKSKTSNNEETRETVDEANRVSNKAIPGMEKKKTVAEQTPRRSSRGLIPNKKFQDSEVEEKKTKVVNTENLIKTPVKLKEQVTVPLTVETQPPKPVVSKAAPLQTKPHVPNNNSEKTSVKINEVSVKTTSKDIVSPGKPVIVQKSPLNNVTVKQMTINKPKDKPTIYNRVSLFKNKYEYTETVIPVSEIKSHTIVKNYSSKPKEIAKVAKTSFGSESNMRYTKPVHKIHSVDKEKNTTAYIVYPSKASAPASSPAATKSSDNEVIEVESIVTIETDSVAHIPHEPVNNQEKEGTGTLIKESLALLNPEQEDNEEYVEEDRRKEDEIEDSDMQIVVPNNMSLSESPVLHRPGKIVRGNEETTVCVNLNVPDDEDDDDDDVETNLRNVVLKLPDSYTPISYSHQNRSDGVTPCKNTPLEVIVPKKKSEILKVNSKGEVIMSEAEILKVTSTGEVIMSEVTPQTTITVDSMPNLSTGATAIETQTTKSKDGSIHVDMKYCNVPEIKVEPQEETVEEGVVHPAGFITSSTHHNVYKTIHNRSSMGHENQRTQTEEVILVELPDGVQVVRKDVNEKHSDSDGCDEDGKYQCKLCSYATHKKANWYKHKTKHIALRNHKCNQCSYRAATSSNLKRHLAIHSDTREFQCAICMLNFRQKIHLERHLKYKHQEKTVSCPICPYLCANENPDLRIHIRRKHMPVDSLSAHMCDECGLVTVSKKDLKQHQKFHKKGPELKFFCENCSFVTDCESRLRRHMFIHTKEKPYQCGLCEYRGSQKEHVLRHMKSQHQVEIERTNRKQNPAPVITVDPPQEVVISDSSEKADYSSEEKIFACNHCTMKFSKLINLYKHLHAQHKGVMPNSEEEFTCVVCDFRTNNKKNLLVHMRKHNAQDQSPPSHVYSCVLCRYMNPRRRNLFQHMKKKHHIEIVLKQDGTANCYMADATTSRVEVQEQSQNESGEVEIVTQSLGINNIISLDEIAMVVSNPMSNTVSTGPVTVTSNTVSDSNTSNVNEHEAAEAIEGLQALAEQAGLVETIVDNVIEEPVQDINIEDQPELLIDESELQAKPGEVADQSGQSIQLTPDQLLNLTSGDYVEINGEMYKVEISTEEKNAAKEIQDMTE